MKPSDFVEQYGNVNRSTGTPLAIDALDFLDYIGEVDIYMTEAFRVFSLKPEREYVTTELQDGIDFLNACEDAGELQKPYFAEKFEWAGSRNYDTIISGYVDICPFEMDGGAYAIVRTYNCEAFIIRMDDIEDAFAWDSIGFSCKNDHHFHFEAYNGKLYLQDEYGNPDKEIADIYDRDKPFDDSKCPICGAEWSGLWTL